MNVNTKSYNEDSKAFYASSSEYSLSKMFQYFIEDEIHRLTDSIPPFAQIQENFNINLSVFEKMIITPLSQENLEFELELCSDEDEKTNLLKLHKEEVNSQFQPVKKVIETVQNLLKIVSTPSWSKRISLSGISKKNYENYFLESNDYRFSEDLKNLLKICYTATENGIKELTFSTEG